MSKIICVFSNSDDSLSCDSVLETLSDQSSSGLLDKKTKNKISETMKMLTQQQININYMIKDLRNIQKNIDKIRTLLDNI